MATALKKTKSVWVCSHCGNEYSKWLGRCPSCGEWNSMVEQEVVTGKAPVAGMAVGPERKPLPLKDVATTQEDRVSLGSAEVDRLDRKSVV